MEMSQGHLEVYDWNIYEKELEVKNSALGYPEARGR